MFARRCATVHNRSQPSATVRNRPREVAMAVPMGSSAKRNMFVVSQRRVASFRVAGVALCDIPTCFSRCQKSVCVTGAILLQRFQKMRCIFRGRRGTLKTDVLLRGRRSTIDVSCCLCFANRNVRAARLCDTRHSPRSTVYTPPLHSTLYTLHSTISIPHFTLYTLHSTPHFQLYPQHFPLYTPHFTLHTLHPTLDTPHSTLYTFHSTLYTPALHT